MVVVSLYVQAFVFDIHGMRMISLFLASLCCFRVDGGCCLRHPCVPPKLISFKLQFLSANDAGWRHALVLVCVGVMWCGVLPFLEDNADIAMQRCHNPVDAMFGEM